MLFLALSCLQGHPMSRAVIDLCSLGPVGVQLTPGCIPTTGFKQFLDSSGTVTRTHQGFAFDKPRGPVWDGARLLSTDDSVHPPRSTLVQSGVFFENLLAGNYDQVALETMYPGYNLGSGGDLELAMDLKTKLAVDVSHIFMQLEMGAMRASTWRRLQEYEHVVEIHLSANDGSSDQHRVIDSTSFGIDWALERGKSTVPVILESYLHDQTVAQRTAQVATLIERLPPTIGDNNVWISTPPPRTPRFRFWRATT